MDRTMAYTIIVVGAIVLVILAIVATATMSHWRSRSLMNNCIQKGNTPVVCKCAFRYCDSADSILVAIDKLK